MKHTSRALLALGIAGLLLLTACTTRNNTFMKVDQQVDERAFGEAVATLSGKDAKAFYPDNDAVVRHLDLGMLKLYARNLEGGIEDLNTAEMLIEENYTKSLTQGAATFLLNDTAMAYGGEDYEDLYLNVFKALAFARKGEFDGAFVEIKRLTNKLNFLEDKYKKIADEMNKDKQSGGKVKAGTKEFYNSALARWISMVLYRADGQIDNAGIDLRKIDEAFAEQKSVYTFPKPDLSKALARPQGARLDFLAFSGRAPLKKAITYRLNTFPNEVRISMEVESAAGVMQTMSQGSIFLPMVEGGYNFKCQVPTMEVRESPVQKVQVHMDGALLGELALIERMDKVAVATFKVKEPITYVKTIARTVIKGIAAAIAKKESDKLMGGNPLLGFVKNVVVDVAVEASEGADLRSGRYIPGYAWVGNFDVPAGAHSFEVRYLDAGNNVLFTDAMGETTLKEKGLNLLNSVAIDRFYAPGAVGGGKK